ncbi:MAG TPA: maleylpyruvate isomerase N-terminal domain-containing protein [Acidimicrobiales bacterium]|nr:maleylpyruvate isomerase N-terminal domain-containing protein [Acidimicrobiales bacterium]
MPRPDQLIDVCVASHERLLVTATRLNDDDLRAPSRLPDWSRGHVLAHLARNADSHTWLFEGAKIGESRRQYPEEGMRERDIEAGSSLDRDTLLGDVTRSCRALEAAWNSLDDDLWDFLAAVSPGPRTMAEILFRRLREVEVHHVDLDSSYDASDWPADYVEGELRRALHKLPERADHAELVEWLIGRRSAPTLENW